MSFKVDLHTHSSHGSFDGRRTYDEIGAECKAKGLDAVVITEHDTPTENSALLEASERHGVLLLPGIELSFGDWGHFIVLGGETFMKRHNLRKYDKKAVIDVFGRAGDRLRASPGEHMTFYDFMEAIGELRQLFKEDMLSPIELSQAAKAHGGFVAWAHPFVATPLRKELDGFLTNGGRLDMLDFIAHLKGTNHHVLDVVSAVDALEGVNGLEQGLISYLATQFASAANKPTISGSDGHREGEFGTAFTEIACNQDSITDVPSLIQALRTCETKAMIGEFIS